MAWILFLCLVSELVLSGVGTLTNYKLPINDWHCTQARNIGVELPIQQECIQYSRYDIGKVAK